MEWADVVRWVGECGVGRCSEVGGGVWSGGCSEVGGGMWSGQV